MTQTKEEFCEDKQQEDADEIVFLIFILIFIFLFIIKNLLLTCFIYTRRVQVTVVETEPVLAIVLVDAMIADGTQEKYLTGYRVEYHKSDISNETKTPDVNANLKFAEYLKFTYIISNYTNSQMLYHVSVEKDYAEKNLKLSYSINYAEEKQFTEDYVAGQIGNGRTVIVCLYAKIADNELDADLSGKFALSITYFADDEDFEQGVKNGTN